MRISDWSSDVCSSDVTSRSRTQAGVQACAWCVCNAADKRVIPRERYLRRSPGGTFPRQRMVPPEGYASVRPPPYSPDRWLCGFYRRAHRPCCGRAGERGGGEEGVSKGGSRGG